MVGTIVIVVVAVVLVLIGFLGGYCCRRRQKQRLKKWQSQSSVKASPSKSFTDISRAEDSTTQPSAGAEMAAEARRAVAKSRSSGKLATRKPKPPPPPPTTERVAVQDLSARSAVPEDDDPALNPDLESAEDLHAAAERSLQAAAEDEELALRAVKLAQQDSIGHVRIEDDEEDVKINFGRSTELV